MSDFYKLGVSSVCVPACSCPWRACAPGVLAPHGLSRAPPSRALRLERSLMTHWLRPHVTLRVISWHEAHSLFSRSVSLVGAPVSIVDGVGPASGQGMSGRSQAQTRHLIYSCSQDFLKISNISTESWQIAGICGLIQNLGLTQLKSTLRIMRVVEHSSFEDNLISEIWISESLGFLRCRL